jgi:hypothetical protein
MVICLDEYRKAKAAAKAAILQQQYHGEERLCVNWLPGAAVLASFGYRHPHEASPALPEDFDAVDVDAFVEHVSALATQI